MFIMTDGQTNEWVLKLAGLCQREKERPWTVSGEGKGTYPSKQEPEEICNAFP